MSRLTAPPATWQHEQESVESLTRRAHELIASSGWAFSPSKVSRLIRKRQQAYRAGTNVDFDGWFMTSYVDPTGEVAIHRLACADAHCNVCTAAPRATRAATDEELSQTCAPHSFGGDR